MELTTAVCMLSLAVGAMLGAGLNEVMASGKTPKRIRKGQVSRTEIDRAVHGAEALLVLHEVVGIEPEHLEVHDGAIFGEYPADALELAELDAGLGERVARAGYTYSRAVVGEHFESGAVDSDIATVLLTPLIAKAAR